MKKTILATICAISALGGTALAANGPKIQFDQLVYDFGKTSRVESVAGTFKFKNTGDETLKLEPPKPTCGCTVAELKTNTLAPGESGELAFTLNLGAARTQMEKHIVVASNDPQTPEVSLAIKVDYTPLYDINPLTVTPTLAFGLKEATEITTITRTDGKPLRITRLDASKPWITAKVEPGTGTNDSTARIRVTVTREGQPRQFNEFVHIHTADRTNAPIGNISISGQMRGEISLDPEALYWSVPNTGPLQPERLESPALKKVTIRSTGGKPLELKNPQSTIKGLKVELVSTEAGKVYELVATLNEVPASTVGGNVSFETSVAAQPRIEVPVIINVYKP